MEDHRKWVKDRYQVKLLAMSSYEASTILATYHLTPESMLNPFSDISHSFSVKSLTKTLSCSSFKVKVFEKIELKKNDQVLSSIGPKVNWQEKPNENQDSPAKILTPSLTPWFNTWKEDFFTSQLFSQHELIDMPLCIIYLASTTDTDPLQTFQTLARPQGLPPLYHSKVYDPKVPKIFLLIHDPTKSNMTMGQVNSATEKVQRALNPSLCYLQIINPPSLSGNLLWENSTCFSQEDSLKLQMMMNEIVIRAVVPFVESALKALDLILEQKKRGLKNSLSKFFSKKERPEAFSFQVDCIEHVCRLLADLAFLFGDYEEAMSHYKSVSHDLKTLKAWAHTGSVHEMMALCSLMSSSDIREAENLMDQAYSYYQKSGDQNLLTRCLLIHHQLFLKPEFSKKMALKLLSGCGDVKDIKYVCPLFTEQAALCYLQCSPCYNRKYAFYLVIAGDEYRKLELVQYALNCYYSASHVYNGRKWEYIEMHIQHMLGRFCYFLNMEIESVHFYLALMDSPKLLQHRDQHQKKIMNELMATVAQWTSMPIPADYNPISKTSIKFHSDGRPVLDFSLPRITKYEIALPQDRILKQGPNVGDFELWKNLLSKEDSVFLDYFKSFDGELTKELSKGLYCEEDIEISINCLNTMNFITVSENLIVGVEYEDGEQIVTQTLETLELAANEEKKVVFQCKPKKPGKIRVQGLKWSFGKVFYGNFKFNPQEFQVFPQVSGLSIQVFDFPNYLFDGEVRVLKVLITNQQVNPVESVNLKFSHSYLFGKNFIDLGELPAGGEKSVDLLIRGEKIGSHLVRFVSTYLSAGQKRFLRLQYALEVKPAVNISTRCEYSLKNIDESILQVVIKPAIESRLEVKQVTPLTEHSMRLIKNIASEVYYIGIQPGEPCSVLFGESQSSNLDPEFVKSIKSILKTNTSPQLDFIIYWELEIAEKLVSGFHFLLSVSVNTSKSNIRTTLSAPSDLKHDFSTNHLCQVPVTLSVKNITSSQFSNLSINAIQDEDFKDFTWVGSTSIKSSTVKPNETVHLRLLASFSKPGSFDLNKFVVRVNDSMTEIPRFLQQILIS